MLLATFLCFQRATVRCSISTKSPSQARSTKCTKADTTHTLTHGGTPLRRQSRSKHPLALLYTYACVPCLMARPCTCGHRHPPTHTLSHTYTQTNTKRCLAFRGRNHTPRFATRTCSHMRVLQCLFHHGIRLFRSFQVTV